VQLQPTKVHELQCLPLWWAVLHENQARQPVLATLLHISAASRENACWAVMKFHQLPLYKTNNKVISQVYTAHSFVDGMAPVLMHLYANSPESCLSFCTARWHTVHVLLPYWLKAEFITQNELVLWYAANPTLRQSKQCTCKYKGETQHSHGCKIWASWQSTTHATQ